MKLRPLRSAVISAASLGALQDALNAFFTGAAPYDGSDPAYPEGGGEREFVSAHFQVDGSTYTVMVLYTGG